MIDKENIYHIWPINDLKPHITHVVEGTNTCPCQCIPRYEKTDNGCLLIIHDAFDGRLGVEWANEILKTTKPFE